MMQSGGLGPSRAGERGPFGLVSLALPTLLAVLAMVVLATRALEAETAEAPLVGKLAHAERAMVYALTPVEGPRFRLAGGEEVVKLLVHLELPVGGAPDAVYRFGIAATLSGPDGGVLWQRTITQRTRQTKEGPRTGGWDYEAAFVVDGAAQLTDAASLELALPDAPPGSSLELRLTADTGTTVGDQEVAPFARPAALVRAYRRMTVDPAERELRRLALASSGERRLPETYLPWYALDAEQQELRLATSWERLAAEGRAGVDYKVRSIYVAPPRSPVPAPAPVPGLALAAGQPLALQLAGPGTVWIDGWTETSEPGALQLRMREVLAAGPGDRSDVPKDRPVETVSKDRSGVAGAPELTEREVLLTPTGRAEISVPPGWWSLEVATNLPARIQVRADAPERHAGADDHAVHADGPGGSGATVPVDVRVLQAYALGPGVAPLPLALAPGDEPEARFLRAEVRAWGTLAPVTVHYSFVDADGGVLAAGDHVADTTRPAPFERLRGLAADGPEDRPVAVVFPLADAAVSEPAAIGLIAPAGAVRLLLTTSEPALVAVRGRLPATRAEEALPRWTWPWGQLEDPTLRWRYAPPARPRTFPRRAEDHATRVASGQVRTIAAQLRIEDVAPGVAAEGPWRAEQPRGAHTRLRLLERVAAGGRKQALATWGPGSYTRLRPGVPETLDLTRGMPRPAKLRYQVTGSALDVVGTSLFVTVDGQGLRWPVTARAGVKKLARGATAGVLWSGSGSVAMLANRPPDGSSGAALYEHRQIHQLGTAGLTVALDKKAAAPVGMNVVVYWLDGAPRPTTLAIEVDGGAPSRRAGTPVAAVFAAERTVEVMPTRRSDAIFPDRRGEAEVAIGRVAVVLGDDVSAGKHTLRIRHVAGPAVWVRMFRAGKSEARSGAWQWSERRSTVAMEEADDDE